jgi:hypothetical protein
MTDMKHRCPRYYGPQTEWLNATLPKMLDTIW